MQNQFRIHGMVVSFNPDFQRIDSPVLFRIFRASTLFFAISLSVVSTTSHAADPQKFVTGNDFTKVLNRPLLVNRDYSPLRSVLQRLSEDRRISICLDRRIDPERLVFVDLQASYFDTGIASLVAGIPANVVVVADTVFVTTPDTARTLRTRIALSEQQLEKTSKANLSRQLDLARKVSIQWEKLASPRELLMDFASRFEVTIQNPEEIPHDLWEAGTISHANFVTGALVIAAQYGLDIEWIDSHQIRLVPQAADPLIEQEHVFRGRTKQQATELVREKFLDLPMQALSDRLRITALIEQQEEVAVLLGNRLPRKPSAAVVATSLANRRFTLRMINRPFVELLDVLEKQGIQFDRHTQLLQDAEINLNQQITLELENATIEKLLTDACAPLRLTFRIDGTHIDLSPAPRPVPEERE